MESLSERPRKHGSAHARAEARVGASGLRFLLTNHGIQDAHQGALFEAGVDTMAKFAAFVTTAADLVEVLKKEFSLDPATSLANRAQAASYTVAWQSAQARTKQQAEVEATSETREWAKPIPVSDYIAMRQRFAKAFGEPEDKRIPAKEYIEKKLAELESSAPRRWERSSAETRWTQMFWSPAGTLKDTCPLRKGRAPWLCPQGQSSFGCG